MTKATQPIPPGHENLIPHLVCDPCSEAIEFYKKAFGAIEVMVTPVPDGRLIHGRLIQHERRVARDRWAQWWTRWLIASVICCSEPAYWLSARPCRGWRPRWPFC